MALNADDQDILTLDPISMNVVNRVAAGSRVEGVLSFNGGVLVQGLLSGSIQVEGPLIIWAQARVQGQLRVNGDVYIFGTLGDADVASTVLECAGMVCVANSGVCNATLLARALRLYQGAEVKGPFKTRHAMQELPVLRDVLAESP